MLKSGTEPLTYDHVATGQNLLDFWRWSASDLSSNVTRGILAEFIVATALKTALNQPRKEWAGYDLDGPNGLKIEVKSAAYLQSWKQIRPSKISFSIRPARSWNEDSATYQQEKTRIADVYIFCLLKHTEATTLNPLMLEQWGFYIVPTEIINEKYGAQHSITLRRIKALGAEINYAMLCQALQHLTI